MDVFIRCNECGQLKAPEQGSYIVVREHETIVCDGQATQIIEKDSKIVWVCTKCVGISFTEADIPSPEEKA